MIVSNEEVLTQRLSELKDALLKQNYPQTVIESGPQRAINVKQSELRRVRQRSEDRVITFVPKFNPPKIQNCSVPYDKI